MTDDKIENTEEATSVLSEDELDKVSGGVNVAEGAHAQGAHAQGAHQQGAHQQVHQSGVKADIFKV